MGLEDLTQMMEGIQTYKDENLVVDYQKSDDAGVYRLSDEIALIESVDFITPIVDDPFIYGQIAASNALSDIFAMGGVAKTAMNVLMWDQAHISKEMVKEILRGGAERLSEAKVSLLGGHSVGDLEQKYGLSVSGVAHPNKIWKNCTAKEGDALVLAKALGTGILATALKNNQISFSKELEGIESMITLNQNASLCAKEFEIHACTDVTGFGLIGHLLEMTSGDKSVELVMENIPLFECVPSLINQGFIPNGSKQNQSYLLPKVELLTTSPYSIALFDAQTSGGLLFALPKAEAHRLVETLKRAGYTRSAMIGEFVSKREKEIYVF